MNLKQFLLGWFYKTPKARKNTVIYNEREIITLRNKGYSQSEIAESVGLTKNQVVGILFKLIKDGKISRKRLAKKIK